MVAMAEKRRFLGGRWRAVVVAAAVVFVLRAPPASPKPSTGPVVALASTPSGSGHWMVDADGRVMTEGDARVFGSPPGRALPRPVVAMAATPSGAGYWLVSRDGTVIARGDAAFRGSAPRRLTQPI